MAVDPMVLFYVHHIVIHGLIVTEPARIACTLAYRIRALKLAGSQVVLATKLPWLQSNVAGEELLIFVGPSIFDLV